MNKYDGLKFETYWKDELTSRVIVHNNHVYIKRYVLHPVKQIFPTNETDVYTLSKILEGRCWERGRKDIDNILNKLNIKYYNPLDIVRKTHGVSYNDFIWIKFEGEKLDWEDIKPRNRRECSNSK